MLDHQPCRRSGAAPSAAERSEDPARERNTGAAERSEDPARERNTGAAERSEDPARERNTGGVLGMLKRGTSLAALLSFAALGAGCSSIDRLRGLGDQPPLTAINNPTAAPGYKPVQMPMPAPQPAIYQPNSLWRTGSRAFFKDQRAHQIGDILTIAVNINDQANWQNETQRSRQNSEDSGIDNFFGKPKVPILNAPVPTKIFTGESTAS